MKHTEIITILVVFIMIAAAVAAGTGIFSTDGPGPYEYETIRGQVVTIHGFGLYRHMSSDVAVQGIGQDYVTLFLGVPLLGVALLAARRGSLRGRLFLAGVLGYFLVTYLFYLVMGMYNIMFLVYASLLGMAFFALALTLLGFNPGELLGSFSEKTPVRICGGFLIVNTFSIAFMWLGVVLPPLLDGSIYPADLQHYTTLIVQGLDLGLLLPLSFVSGLLLIRKREMGFLLGPVYLVFLSFLMTALVAKIVAMGLTGVNIMPAVVIIPATAVITITCAALMFRSIRPLKDPEVAGAW